mmetsp:Transcript_9023/g.26947  ORF Transcript_9023/g.26947 Transcript_9023/m.26947 type:complete len:1468 (-) Transcript_9023:215-4618(-)
MRQKCSAATAATSGTWAGLPASLTIAALLAFASPIPAFSLDDGVGGGGVSNSNSRPEEPEGCSLVCLNDGVCQKGSDTYPDILRMAHSGGSGIAAGGEDDDADVVPFLQRTDDGNGEYCWCPDGWTGFDCSHQYEWCWYKPEAEDGSTPANGFACFHGAKCIEAETGDTDKIEYYCDCRSASTWNGTQEGLFAGLHCEHSAKHVCREGFESDQWVGFCVNGGSCKEDDTHLCDCPSEWMGPHCEFYKPPPPPPDIPIEIVEVSSCNLNCAHNGVCNKGDAVYPQNIMPSNGAPIPFLQRTSNSLGEFCLCQEGWTGYDCEHRYRYCWDQPNTVGVWDDGFACFHGGICKVIHGQGPMTYNCDCAAASWPDGTRRGLFAGTQCEYSATSICWKDGMFGAERDRIGFCVNGGTCNPSETVQERLCNCPPEWTGSYCEYYKGKATTTTTLPATTTAAPDTNENKPQKPDDCSLQCFHNGVCQKGSADYPNSLQVSADSAIVPFLQRTSNEQGEYCWCPSGYTGYDCGHEYKYCWEEFPSNGTWASVGFACFHGGTCKAEPGGGTKDYICDCSTTLHPDLTHQGLYAGVHCEYSALDWEICREADVGPGDWLGFCVNGGICKLGETQQSNMCDCPAEWSGPHCEFYKEEDTAALPEVSTSTTTAPGVETNKPQPANDCAHECSNSGVCQKGEAVFPDSIDTTREGEPIPFLQQTSDSNGEYCWCPDGWTGFDCAHSYELCEQPNDDGSGGLACFHGGKCDNVSVGIGQPELDQVLCDCSEASWRGLEQGLFAGQHCEFKATDVCTIPGQDKWVGFCVNGGTCVEGEAEQFFMCNCPPSWTGPHCETFQGPLSEDNENPQRPTPDSDCDLKCDNSGVCQKGPADYGIISPKKHDYSSPIPFLEIDSDNQGQHCWCPPGLTGIDCGHKYQVCDSNNLDEKSRGVCFHSSKCVDILPGASVTWACDCSTANDKGSGGGLFAGQYCEHEVTEKCQVLGTNMGLSEKEWFCVNGGTCTTDESNPYKICQCSDDWTGPHCEYAVKSTASTKYAPVKCSLGCRNDGNCVFGVKDYGDHVHNNEAKELPWLSKTHSNGMHCVCRKGYTGLLCQIPAEKCGEQLWCYNGSKCKMTRLEDGSTKKYCDCGEAATKEASFAGIGCQHKSSVFCNPDEGMTEKMAYCVNGGSCFETGNGHLGCDCPDDWKGIHCEFHKSEAAEYSNPNACKLECKNGGKCSAGVKDFGTAETSGLPFLKEKHINFEHCVCPAGFTGVDCSIKFDVCDENHACPYGSTCSFRGKTVSGKKMFTCNCKGVTDENGNAVAGEHCQHQATEYCVLRQSSLHSFCTHNGKCVDQISAEEKHPGCICPPGWTGNHCEFQQKQSTEASQSASSLKLSENAQAVIIFSAMAVVIAVIISIAVLLTKKYATSEALEREEQNRQVQESPADTSTAAGSDTFNAEPDHGDEETDDGKMSGVDIL